jgi:kinesin family protein 5
MASQLFKRITEDKEGTEFTIKCSFMEIYKERVRDLLNPKSVNLKVHETPTRGVWVEDITEEFVATEDDVLELLRLGDKFRAVTPTRMNDASSRSHR